MPYKVTDRAAVVLVRNQNGGLDYHTRLGPKIDWLSSEQARHYEELGLIEAVDSEENE